MNWTDTALVALCSPRLLIEKTTIPWHIFNRESKVLLSLNLTTRNVNWCYRSSRHVSLSSLLFLFKETTCLSYQKQIYSHKEYKILRLLPDSKMRMDQLDICNVLQCWQGRWTISRRFQVRCFCYHQCLFWIFLELAIIEKLSSMSFKTQTRGK